jgi:hypothetical protein
VVTWRARRGPAPSTLSWTRYEHLQKPCVYPYTPSCLTSLRPACIVIGRVWRTLPLSMRRTHPYLA